MPGQLRVWLYGAAIALAACLHYPLMYSFRAAWVARFPTYTKSWPSDGRFSEIGYYGMEDGDASAAAPMVREFSRRLRPRDPYVLKEGPAIPQDYLPYRVLGGILRLTGDINATWFIGRLLACLLWFVLLFRAARLLSIPESAALFCAAFCTCFGYVLGFFFLGDLHWSENFIKTAIHTVRSITIYGRTEGVWRLPRPGFSHIGLFAAVLVWGRAAASRKALPWILVGICGGLLSYVRIDVWSGFFGAACLFPWIQAALLRRLEWRWFYPAAITAVFSLPVLSFSLNPPGDFLLKASMTSGAGADWMSFAYLPFAAWILSRRRDELHVFFAALILSVFAICNVGLITGRSLYTPNWHAYANIYIFILSVSFLPPRWLNHRWIWKTATAAVIGVTLALNIGYAGIRYPWHGIPSAYDDAFQWLNAHARPDSVVATLSAEANELIPCFTPLKTLIGNAAPIVSNISIQENVERIIFNVDIMGGDPKAFFNTILRPVGPSDMRYALDRVKEDARAMAPHAFATYPENLLREKIGIALTSRRPKPFPVDYVWVGPFDRLWLGSRFPAGAPLPLQRVFSNGVVDLYRANSDPQSWESTASKSMSIRSEQTPNSGFPTLVSARRLQSGKAWPTS